MKRILVPKYKCPLDVLAEMGEKTKDAWIFLHQNVIEKLKQTADRDITFCVTPYREFTWKETETYPKTLLAFEKRNTEWKRVFRIYADDIAFTLESSDPEEIYFLKMEE